MKYNRNEIFATAWQFLKDKDICAYAGMKLVPGRPDLAEMQYSFSRALKAAWADAKKAAQSAEVQIEALETQVFMLNMKDRHDSNDRDILRKWESEIKRLKETA